MQTCWTACRWTRHYNWICKSGYCCRETRVQVSHRYVFLWNQLLAPVINWLQGIVTFSVWTWPRWKIVKVGRSLYMKYRTPSQYPKRRLFVRSRKVSKPRDLYLEFSDRSEIWQALRQHGCRCACEISKRYDNLKYQSRGFETSQDLTKRSLFGYWDGALQVPFWIEILSFDV